MLGLWARGQLSNFHPLSLCCRGKLHNVHPLSPGTFSPLMRMTACCVTWMMTMMVLLATPRVSLFTLRTFLWLTQSLKTKSCAVIYKSLKLRARPWYKSITSSTTYMGAWRKQEIAATFERVWN